MAGLSGFKRFMQFAEVEVVQRALPQLPWVIGWLVGDALGDGGDVFPHLTVRGYVPEPRVLVRAPAPLVSAPPFVKRRRWPVRLALISRTILWTS